jgi:hypothetical protein
MKTIQSNLFIDKVQDLVFCTLFYSGDVVVSEISQGAVIGLQEAHKIFTAVDDHFQGVTKVHYISNRINDYSIKPIEWSRLKRDIQQFKSYNAIIYSRAGMTNLMFERQFTERSIPQFDSLEEAMKFIKMQQLETSLVA